MGEVCEKILSGGTPSTEIKEYWEGNIPWITSADISGIKDVKPRRFITKQAIDNSATNLIPKNNIIVVTRVGLGKLLLNDFDLCISQDSQGLIVDKSKIVPEFLVYLLSEEVKKFKDNSRGSTIQGVTKSQLTEIKIPLLPLSVQQEIVAEIEGYRKIIDGARQVVENYKPRIKVDEGWEVVELGDVVEINPSKNELKNMSKDLEVSFLPMSDLHQKQINFEIKEKRKLGEVIKGYTFFKNNDVLLAKITPCFENRKSGIAANLINSIGFGSTEFIVFRPGEKVIPEWIYYFISDGTFLNIGKNNMTGSAGQQRLSSDFVKSFKIPLPPLDVQKQIVARIEEEQKLVDANKKLIELFEGKIKEKIAEVWGQI